VQGDDVVGLVTNTLDYIDLANGILLHVVGPECWPDTALIAGHMGDIGDQDAVVECILRLETHAVPALRRRRYRAGIVGAEEYLLAYDFG